MKDDKLTELQRINAETLAHLENAGRNLDKAERNIQWVIWMWKWLLLPMWAVIIGLKLWRWFHEG